MNQKQYKYSVLKYRPSYWLDEQVNIGLLFLFPEDGKVEFLYPTQLKRIHDLFPESNISLVKSYLSAFKIRSNEISKQKELFELSFESILREEFLIPDANAFFFSSWKTGFYETPTKLLDFYSKSYFSNYYRFKKENNRDETWISNQFSTYLKRKSVEKFHLFKREVNLKNNIAHASFDYSWQNGTLNLVKPLGFDLQSPDSILDKSNLWLGKITCLKPLIDKENYRVDFLVSEPDKQNLQLNESFKNALGVLENLDIDKKIVYVKELHSYIDNALEKVKLR